MAASALLLLCPTAISTTLGIVREAFVGEKLLFSGIKSERDPAVDALQFPICETHWMPSFLEEL
jgi:hypothetical protein